jgi:Glycosyltransferase family 87
MTTISSSSFHQFRVWKWLLLSMLCAASMWTYANRVLIPHQVSDAIMNGRPRGNLSDLYPRWLGARELLLRGRDPYSPALTREIQQGYYGRPVDPARVGDPKDQQGFAYPVYVVFLLAPTIHLPFEIVQKIFFWLLLGLTVSTIPLWLRVLHWSVPWWAGASMIALAVGSISSMQGLKLQQMTVAVIALMAIALALLVSDRPVAAGVALALASVKPQLLVIFLLWLMVWALSDWRRLRLAISFLVTMIILVAASEWCLPHWISRFWRAIHEYQSYTGAMSVLDKSIGTPLSLFLEVLVLAAMAQVCWRERRQAVDTDAFAFTTSLVLAITVLVMPTFANYNQVLLIPAMLLLAKDRQEIWQKGFANRVLLIVTAFLIVWPWGSSFALVCLSFVLSQQTVERGWAIPFWSVVQTPLAVTAMMLMHYYQHTFPARTKAGAS